MKALWTAGVGALVLAACLAAGSGAAMNAPSGDTCTVNGGGTSVHGHHQPAGQRAGAGRLRVRRGAGP